MYSSFWYKQMMRSRTTLLIFTWVLSAACWAQTSGVDEIRSYVARDKAVLEKDPTLRARQDAFQAKLVQFQKTGSPEGREKLESEAAELFSPSNSLASLEAFDQLTCDGKPIGRIDLRTQFLPTRDQKGLGTCAAHSAAALLEAALFRNTGERWRLSSEYVAVCDLASNYSRILNAVEELQKGEAKWLPLEGGWTSEMIRAATDRGLIYSGNAEKLFADVNCKVRATVQEQGIKATAEDVARIVQAQLKEALATFEKAGVVTQFDLSDYKGLGTFWQGAFGQPFPYLDEVKAHPQSPLIQAMTSLRNPLTAKIAGSMMRDLCAGRPVAVGLWANGVLRSKDGGKTWEAMKSENMHGVVLQGFGYEAGKPYFYFRDSKAEGTAEMPHRSVLKIPVGEACRIDQTDPLVGPRDNGFKPQFGELEYLQ